MFEFTKDELRDIVVAIFFLTMIFAFTFSPSLTLNLVFILPAFLAVLTAFFLHEMAHKYMAIRFSCDAHFKLWPKGILLGLITMFIPFITFVAPGATVINPYRHGRWAFKPGVGGLVFKLCGMNPAASRAAQYEPPGSLNLSHPDAAVA